MSTLPVALARATTTPRSETRPVVVRVAKPRGTLYWGGAGLDGPYIPGTLNALREAGIDHVHVGLTNTASRLVKPTVGTLIDAIRAGLLIRYEDNDDWIISSGMDRMSPQFNLLGYSYGSLLAAQTANSYARQGHVVDHLILIGSPIDAGFLARLRQHANIRKVIVIDLTSVGDPIYAGMTQAELLACVPELARTMQARKGEGHFFYGHVVPDSPTRWASLARMIHAAGVR
jgi:hypothetical protein